MEMTLRSWYHYCFTVESKAGGVEIDFYQNGVAKSISTYGVLLLTATKFGKVTFFEQVFKINLKRVLSKLMPTRP